MSIPVVSNWRLAAKAVEVDAPHPQPCFLVALPHETDADLTWRPKCSSCGREGVPMLLADSSQGEHSLVCVCETCIGAAFERARAGLVDR